MKTSLLSLLTALAFALPAFAEHQAGHTKSLVLKNKDGLAIEGYDPVAYFTDNKAVKGNAKLKSNYDGANYLFASAAHQAMFDAAPAKYAPAYGGYCGYAASINRLSPISPEWFQIEDGKLILQHNKKAFDLFNKELKPNVQKADSNWPGLVEKNGVFGGKTLVQIDSKTGVALEGYDAVTYFSGGKPQKGDAKIEGTYNGALYHFVSQENRATFEKDPTKYAPAYGGYSAQLSRRIRRNMRLLTAATAVTPRASARCAPAIRSSGPSWRARSFSSTPRARTNFGRRMSPATRPRPTIIGRA